MAFAQLADLILLAEADGNWDWTPLIVQNPVQVVNIARALNARQLDRGNALVGYAFTVARVHESYAAAGLFLDDLPRVVVRAFGEFTADRGLGGPQIRLTGAKVVGIQALPHKGLRTVVTYTVHGSIPADLL